MVQIQRSLGLASACHFSMAIQEDHSLWAWGENANASNIDGTGSDTVVPVKIAEQAAAVSCVRTHTALLKTDGSVWTWGENQFGQIGDGTMTIIDKKDILEDHNPRHPVRILDRVVSLSPGHNKKMAN